MFGNTEAFAFQEARDEFINGIGPLSLVPHQTNRFITSCHCRCVTLAIRSLQEYMRQLASEGAQILTVEEAQTLLQVFQAIIHNVHRNHEFQLWRPYKVQLALSRIAGVDQVRIVINLQSQEAIDAFSPGQNPRPMFAAACENFLMNLWQDLRQQSPSNQPKSLAWSYLHWNSAENVVEPWDGDVPLSFGEFDLANLLATRLVAPELQLFWNQAPAPWSSNTAAE